MKMIEADEALYLYLLARRKAARTRLPGTVPNRGGRRWTSAWPG